MRFKETCQIFPNTNIFHLMRKMISLSTQAYASILTLLIRIRVFIFYRNRFISDTTTLQFCSVSVCESGCLTISPCLFLSECYCLSLSVSVSVCFSLYDSLSMFVCLSVSPCVIKSRVWLSVSEWVLSQQDTQHMKRNPLLHRKPATSLSFNEWEVDRETFKQ